MADQKKPDLFSKQVIFLQAAEGKELPVRYRGSWVRVTSKMPVDFVVAELPYEAKIEIAAAVQAKHLNEVQPMQVKSLEAEAKPEPKAPAKPAKEV